MRVIFALPGNSFSGQFFLNWNNFLPYLQKNDINPVVSIAGGSNVCQVRQRCLLPKRPSGKITSRSPFDGELDYDYIMWIDSDTMFTGDDFGRLVNRNVDIVAGVVKMDPQNYSGMPKRTPQNFETTRYFIEEDLKTKDLVEAYWASMAFMLVKKGVFEAIKPPWFLCTMREFAGNPDVMVSEDIYFNLLAQEAGFKVWVDPTVKVGHQKLQIF